MKATLSPLFAQTAKAECTWSNYIGFRENTVHPMVYFVLP